MSAGYVFGATETQLETVSIDEALSGAPKGTKRVRADESHPQLEDEEFKIIKNQFERRQLEIAALQQRQTVPELVIMRNIIGLFSEQELIDISVAEVTNTNTSGLGSVNDPRAGVIDGDLVCALCKLDNFQCPGHLLRMRIPPIYHPFYLREVIYILQCVCRSCSGLYMSEKQIRDRFSKLPVMERIAAIADASENLKCDHYHGLTSEQQSELREGRTEEEYRSLLKSIAPAHVCKPKVKYLPQQMKDKHQVYYKTEKSNEPRLMNIKEVKSIFSAITERDKRLLGFEDVNPKDMIMSWLPVTPPITRTPIPTDGILMQHKTTAQYIKIKKKADELFALERSGQSKVGGRKKVLPTVESLFEDVRTLFEGSSSQVFAGFKQFKSFKDLIQGKEGAIRNLLMGKRGNITARTVLSVDPTLMFGQISIPKKMAPYLTPKEIVYQYNRDRLLSMLPENLSYLQSYTYNQLFELADKYNIEVPETISMHNELVRYESEHVGSLDDTQLMDYGNAMFNFIIDDIHIEIQRILAAIDESGKVNIDIGSAMYYLFGREELNKYPELGKSALIDEIDRRLSALKHDMRYASDPKHGNKRENMIAYWNKANFIASFSYEKIIKFAEILQLNDLRELVDGIIDVYRQDLLTLIVNAMGHDQGRITHIIKGNSNIVGEANQIQVVMNPKKPYVLEYGDQVMRWLRNGDMIIFNRQPTLHKHSIMAYEVVLSNDDTIGLHPSYTTPHNADFDGDEGALYGLMTYESEAEARNIMNVTECIMTASENKNIMGLIIDNITASYKLTNDKTEVDAELFIGAIAAMTYTSDVGPDIMNFIATGKPEMNDANEPLHPDSLAARLYRFGMSPTSGKSLFSALLPYDFQYEKDDVLIVDGVLLKGRIKKDHVGPYVHRSIIQMIHESYVPPPGGAKPGYLYGMKRTVIFMTDAPFLLNYWLSQTEQSVGVEDCILPTDSLPVRKEKRDRLLQEIESKQIPREKLTKEQLDILNMIPQSAAELQIKQEIENIKNKIESYGPKLDDTLEEAWRENQIVGELKSLKSFGIKLAKEAMRETNNLRIMVGDIGAGAKGSAFQVAQSRGLAGQQFYRGQRPKASLTHGTRTLPHFPRNSDSIEARGFIKHSFWEGFTPAEFWYHMYGGREGLIDIANNTGESGYMHRRTVKALENITVEYDGSVRNKVGTIFQYIYGNDGLDAAKMISVKRADGVSIPFFIDVQDMAARLNSHYGFIPKKSLPKSKL